MDFSWPSKFPDHLINSTNRRFIGFTLNLPDALFIIYFVNHLSKKWIVDTWFYRTRLWRTLTPFNSLLNGQLASSCETVFRHALEHLKCVGFRTKKINLFTVWACFNLLPKMLVGLNLSCSIGTGLPSRIIIWINMNWLFQSLIQ